VDGTVADLMETFFLHDFAGAIVSGLADAARLRAAQSKESRTSPAPLLKATSYLGVQ
jgi:hypothetical protein